MKLEDKKRIVFFFNDLSMTGAPIVFSNYLECSIKNNLFKSIVCSRYGGDLKETLPDCHIIRKNIRQIKVIKLLSKFIDLIKILLIFIKVKPDLIITNTYINSLPIIAGKLLNCKVVCFVHENIGANIQYLSIRKYFINSADLIIAVSEATLQFCLLNGADRNKIRKVTNGIDLSKFEIRNPQTTKNQYAFGAIANWSEHKRLDKVLNVFENLCCSSNIQFKLLIGGDAYQDYTSEFENLKNKYKSKTVQFIGKVYDKNSFYSKIDGYLFFSEFESFPTVLLETLFYQIPTFTLTEISSAKEVAENALIQGKDEKDIILNILGFYNTSYQTNYYAWQKTCISELKKHDLRIKWNEIEVELYALIKKIETKPKRLK